MARNYFIIINSLLSPGVGGGLLENNGLFTSWSKIIAHGKKLFHRERGMFSLVSGRKELNRGASKQRHQKQQAGC